MIDLIQQDAAGLCAMKRLRAQYLPLIRQSRQWLGYLWLCVQFCRADYDKRVLASSQRVSARSLPSSSPCSDPNCCSSFFCCRSASAWANFSACAAFHLKATATMDSMQLQQAKYRLLPGICSGTSLHKMAKSSTTMLQLMSSGTILPANKSNRV